MVEESSHKRMARILGEYLPVSRGAVRMAMQKKREARLKGKPVKSIGEILIETGAITREDLDIAVKKQRADRLGQCPVFASLSSTELIALGSNFKEISLPADRQFIMQGENDATLYVLVAGRVEVFRMDDDGTRIHIAYVSPVEPIGEMGYFQHGERVASVRTVDPVELLSAPYSSLTHYFENVPRVALAFLDVVKRRQEETERRMKENK